MAKLRNYHAKVLKTISLLEATNDRNSKKIHIFEKETEINEVCQIIQNKQGNAKVRQIRLEVMKEQQNSVGEYVSLDEKKIRSIARR